MDLKLLENIGLTPKEVDVYLALINSGTTSIFNLMSKAKVSRKSIYEILQKLLDKGLVSYIIKDNKKQFTAVNPQRLVELVKEKEENIKAMLPELMKKYKETKTDTQVEVFLGTEGMKTITNNLLKTNTEFYVLANEGKIFNFLKYYMPQFQKTMNKQNLKGNIIYSESARKKDLLKPYENKIRYAPNELNSSPMALAIYGPNVNILIFSEHNPVAIHIKSVEIAQSFMNYFKLMWNISKE